MRILLTHNRYGSAAPSGENQAFDLERQLLERHGHEVRTFVRESDAIRRRGVLGLAQAAVATPWNPLAAHAIRRAVEEFRPDVVHVHNTFPLISPAIFSALRKRAARVLTLHNYRLFCAAGIPLRNGKTCTECLDRRSALPAVRHGCYRGSRLATLPLAASVALHRFIGTWTRDVDAFIALTEFQRDAMVAAGLSPDRVWVKPNFYPGHPYAMPWSKRGDYAVFAGRLTEEKGVVSLVQAWSAWGAAAPELRIVGDGPLRSRLELLEKQDGAGRVKFLGQLPSPDAEAQIAAARLLVIPSICLEGFPMVLREAFAFGTPPAVSNLGALPRLVTDGHNGLVFSANDPQSLLRIVRDSWGRLENMSGKAREAYQEKYAEPANHQLLLRIYRAAIEVQKQKAAA